MDMFFSYENLQFRYEPFPIGLAKPLMSDQAYRQFLDNFPPIDRFESFEAKGKRGRKYTLSEKENPRAFNDFVQSKPLWREFHRWIKSDDFAYGVLKALAERNIDLGYEATPPVKRFVKRARHALTGRMSERFAPLKARFEFSALPADGGNVVPHTDAPTKIVTMVVSIVDDGEWDPAFGGGTDVNQPKDQALAFNHLNRLADFEDMEVLDTFEFTPNQAVVFVKTFNSWHSVRPMTGNGSQALRRALTINIERLT
jgi:hypothetical protein